ncbi:unnamed protein product, partial [Colletotrichum noveboracense]
AYLEDAYDLLHYTLENEPQAQVDLESLPYRCSILDYGIRTGIGSSETAERVEMLFGQVVGYDVTNIHPSIDKLPANLSIHIGDDDKLWRKGTSYDIIHARVVERMLDWQSFPKRAYDSLNPGGRLIVELIDLTPQSDDDNPLPAGSALEVWAQKLYNYDGQQRGYEQVQAIQEILKAQGFDVTCTMIDLPINSHRVSDREKETGKRFHWCLRQFLQAKCFAPHSELPPQELFDTVTKATQEIRNLNHQAFCTCYVLTASKKEDKQKPWW